MKRTLASILLVSILGLFGCKKSSDEIPRRYVEGYVVEESGTFVGLAERSDYAFENREKKNEYYCIDVLTDEGRYVIQIDMTDKCGSSGPVTPYNLELAIKKGTRIRFLKKIYEIGSKGEASGFVGETDRMGILGPDDIQIIDRNK